MQSPLFPTRGEGFFGSLAFAVIERLQGDDDGAVNGVAIDHVDPLLPDAKTARRIGRQDMPGPTGMLNEGAVVTNNVECATMSPLSVSTATLPTMCRVRGRGSAE